MSLEAKILPPPQRAIRTIDRVAQAVAGLPKEEFLQAVDLLATAQEQPRVEGVLSRVRPRLRDLRPDRALSLKRLFCQPFEDLLVTGRAATSGGDRILRSAVAPIWRAIERRNRARFDSLAAELKQLAVTEPKRRGLAVAERLWRIAGATLASEAPLSLDSPDAVRLIRESLGAALEIEAFKRSQPRAPAPLDATVKRDILTGLRLLQDRGLPPDGFLRVVAARLEAPEALGALIEMLTVDKQDEAYRHGV